jgi:site-specific recombinase XerD
MEPNDVLLRDLAKHWVADLRLQGRSQRTIDWYRQKLEAYLGRGGARTLNELTADSLRAYIAGLQERELAENTIHGCFQVLKSLANWADREGYEVDPDVLRLRGPKLPELEMETYSTDEVKAAIQRASPAWARLSVQILVGTGLRVSELCGLQLDDFEDDADATFLKVRRGKGGKFRRVPVSPRLRKAINSYVDRYRAAASSTQLLLTTGGQPVRVETCSRMLHRLGTQLGYRVHAHKFRHTFATTYLRNGGDMERLRRILGHTTYAMVMRYVHLRKDDLYTDFDRRTPF